MSQKLFVISAPSGTGKTTLCARLLERFPRLSLSISTTTRKPRGSEVEGKEYFFVTKERFESDIEADRFAEWARVHDNFYGTSKAFIQSCFDRGQSVLLDIDVQGADALAKSYPSQTVRIFVHPPSLEVLEQRLRSRGTDSEETIQKRMSNARSEIAQSHHFDHQVVNRELDTASKELIEIVALHLGESA